MLRLSSIGRSHTLVRYTDASFIPDMGRCRVGAMARDHSGMMFFSRRRSITQCAQIEEAEAAAVLIGLNALSKMYRHHVILEIDCSVLFNDPK